MGKLTNPPRDQDRAEDLIDNWRKHGYVMFPQQRRIYEQIAYHASMHESALEAGCGAGIGSAMISYAMRGTHDNDGTLIGTDKLDSNVEFAKQLYPWIEFGIWDIERPWRGPKAAAVVAVEVIEHVADPNVALHHLINAATDEVWISTPNGNGKPRPPENPFHVAEYTPDEMLNMIHAVRGCPVGVLGWEDFKPVPTNTDVSPLVYRIKLR